VIGYLLDTNVVSEIRRPQPEARVIRWLDSIDSELLYLSVITLGEIRTGIDRMPEGKQRSFLNDWFTAELRPWLADRILPVTDVIAERWGSLDAQRRRHGSP
jgi:toxin FitB